jgi:hypothetical protein
MSTVHPADLIPMPIVVATGVCDILRTAFKCGTHRSGRVEANSVKTAAAIKDIGVSRVKPVLYVDGAHQLI